MNNKFLSAYKPAETEDRIYDLWEKSGYFNPDNLPGERSLPFTIIMPPPNVTGILHMGHALMIAVEDAMVRFERMRGRRALWVPGTDHAAIATQSVVEKEIYKKEDKSRHDLGRDEFLKRVEQFARVSHDTIVAQVKKFGASCDWSREAFTLDEERSLAVRTAFKMMYDQGLIYRGERIVNWDPKGQTTVSDDEMVYIEEKTKLYYLKYGPFTIATARPETKFGDKYVVMHPDDARYKGFHHGQELEVEWINGPIKATVIKDARIDMEFGTGVMTITPAHSVVDFDIAETHKLDKEQVIDKVGKLLPIAGEFAGIKIKDAREKIVDKLREKGLLVKEEDYMHNVATAERTGGLIEPQIMTQWFVGVDREVPGRGKTLKDLMREPVEQGYVKILPDYFDKTYFHWIDKLRDWCISRQIWYGHRIPVWYRGDEMYCDIVAPAGEGWEQDPDTLDTWFSSSLWSFSTLGWPAETRDLEIFHPTDVLETGYEILFFWVARMILMTGFCLGDIPFRNVYLHGTVRDAQGRKMSKSLGNGIDPLDIAREYGADAGRMALLVGTAPGTDSKISLDKIKGYKNFANKLWNIARFVLSTENTGELNSLLREEIDKLAREVTDDMENFRMHLAAEKLYAYIWHRFADEILEQSKGKPDQGETLRYILENSLKLLHPFMPFITEEIWQEMHPGKLLMIEDWPTKQ